MTNGWPARDGITTATAFQMLPNPLDPDDRYRDVPTRAVDTVAEQVRLELPAATIERTRDVYQFTCDDPERVVMILTPDSLELRLPTVEWTLGYAGPAPSSRLLKRVRIGPSETIEPAKLAALIRHARRVRRSECRPCVHCGRTTPPEQAHELLNPREVSTHDESAARSQAADLRTRAENLESQVSDLERQLTSVRSQITANGRTESTLRTRLLVP